MQYFYSAQIKRYLTQFMRVMSLFSYKDSAGKLIQVPVRYGDVTRHVAAIVNKNSENILQSAPFIACYIKDIQFDRPRMQDPTFVSKVSVRERAFDDENQQYLNCQGANYTVERIMPTPFVATFAADIWTTNLDQKLQLFEQISVLFTPSMEIQTNDNFLDWTSLSVLELDTSQFETRTIPQGLDTNISVTSMGFKSPIWISPPAKVKKMGIITKIIANVFAESSETGKSGGYDDIGYGDIFVGDVADAQVIVTPDNCELLVLDGVAKLLPIKQTATQNQLTDSDGVKQASWLQILDLYPGKFRAGLSQLRLLKPDGTEIVAFMNLSATDETIMNLTYDTDTIPANTIIADLTNSYTRGTVDAVIDPQRYNPGNPAVDTRYLILEDINPDWQDAGYSGPAAWKNADNTDFVAHANDIIQWDGVRWNVIFDSAVNNAVTYVTNSYTGIQYKWENSQWSKSFEGVYPMKNWRIIL
jgi:hypothetical protein